VNIDVARRHLRLNRAPFLDVDVGRGFDAALHRAEDRNVFLALELAVDGYRRADDCPNFCPLMLISCHFAPASNGIP
jgi:hypothetical protein